MASLVTVAQGVYIVKPDYDTSRAKNYADIYTKRRNEQLQLALNAAQRDLGTEAAVYAAQMEAYQRHLNSLVEAKSDLEKQLATGFVDLEKTLLAKKSQVEIANAQLQEKRAEAKGKKMTISRSMAESESSPRGSSSAQRGQYGARNIPTQNQAFIDNAVKRGQTIGQQVQIAEQGFSTGGMQSTSNSAPATRAGIVRGLVEQATATSGEDPDTAELAVIQELSNVPGGTTYIDAYRAMLAEESVQTGGGSGGGSRSTKTAYTTPVSAYGGLGGQAPAATTPEFSPELAAYRQGLEKRISSIQNEIYGLQQPTPPTRQDLLGRTQQLQEQYYGRGRERPIIDAVSSGIQSLRARGSGKGGTMAATAPTPPATPPVTPVTTPAAPQEPKPVEVKLTGTGRVESITPGSTDDFMRRAAARAATLAGGDYDSIIKEGPGKIALDLQVANYSSGSKNRTPLQATIEELQKQYSNDPEALLTSIVAAMAINDRQKRNAPRVESQTVTK